MRIQAIMIGGALAMCAAPLSAQAKETEREETEQKETDPKETEPPPPPDWSVGVGVGLSGIGIGLGQGGAGQGGVGGLAGALPWFYVTSIERRIATGTWVTLSGSGSYSSTHDDAMGDASSWSVTGNIGLRQVFNPEDSFQVSVFGSVGPSYSSWAAPTTIYDAYNFPVTVDLTSTSWDVHAQAGLALEQAFTEHLGMRLSVAMLRASYSETHNTFLWYDSEYPAEGDATGFSASVGLSPQLELRFRW